MNNPLQFNSSYRMIIDAFLNTHIYLDGLQLLNLKEIFFKTIKRGEKRIAVKHTNKNRADGSGDVFIPAIVLA